MSVGTHYGPALRGVATRFEAALPALVTAVDTAQGVRLRKPVDYTRVRREADASVPGAQHARLPRVFIVFEGSVEGERWITPQVDYPVPLLVRLVFREAQRKGMIEDIADAYAEAIERCVDTIAIDEDTGVWWYEFEDTTIEQHGEDPWRRQVDIRGEFKVRTSRSE